VADHGGEGKCCRETCTLFLILILILRRDVTYKTADMTKQKKPQRNTRDNTKKTRKYTTRTK
jgi:hypothetical protein